MMKLSAIILSKNNEDTIENCLHSLSFADEIIVVDNRSTDKTTAIAKKYNAIIIVGQVADFAKSRMIGKNKAKGEWVLYVDTDEQVTPKLRENIQAVINNTADNIVAYKIKRRNFYLGNTPWPKIETLERLFKKSHLLDWIGKLHESAQVDGAIGTIDGYLFHHTHKDLSSMLVKTISWSSIEASLRFENNHPPMSWWRFLRVIWTGFSDSYISQQGYKAGTVGLIESIYQAFSLFITYAKLWELQRKNK